MAQHLLVAADRFELERLRRICERRLCETLDVETVAATLTLAEQSNAEVSSTSHVSAACQQCAPALLNSPGLLPARHTWAAWARAWAWTVWACRAHHPAAIVLATSRQDAIRSAVRSAVRMRTSPLHFVAEHRAFAARRS